MEGLQKDRNILTVCVYFKVKKKRGWWLFIAAITQVTTRTNLSHICVPQHLKCNVLTIINIYLQKKIYTSIPLETNVRYVINIIQIVQG